MQGTDIEAVPVAHTTWRDWKARHPDTEVLFVNMIRSSRYGSDPYGRYQSSDRLMFPVARKIVTIEWHESENYARVLDA